MIVEVIHVHNIDTERSENLENDSFMFFQWGSGSR